jgi:hypothetical protein
LAQAAGRSGQIEVEDISELGELFLDARRSASNVAGEEP